MIRLKGLELFAGSKSIGRALKQRGHLVCSVDHKPFDGIDVVADIEHLTIEQLPFIPDFLWASPPCTSYSQAAISYHRPTGKPKTEFAEKSDRMMLTLLHLIAELLIINPEMLYYIENPRASLRKQPFMVGLEKAVVCYCKYGAPNMKPTDIFTNNLRSIFNPDGWQPRALCFNGNPHCQHERAPRGSATGTQGLSNNYERSKIPEPLCIEIIMASENKLQHCLGYGVVGFFANAL